MEEERKEYLKYKLKYYWFQIRYFWEKAWFPLYQVLLSTGYLALRTVRGIVKRMIQQIRF